MTETESFGIRWQVKDVKKDDKKSGRYYTIDLPPGIADLGLKPGDYVKPELETEEYPMYIHGRKSDGDGSSPKEYKIRGSEESPRLTVPAGFCDNFIEEPVYQLVVEINEEQGPPHLRLYNVEKYFQIRKLELSDKDYDIGPGEPLVISLFSSKTVYREADGTKVVDLTVETPWQGQRFRLIPFDAQHKVFTEESGRAVDADYTPEPDLFKEVRNRRQPPSRRIWKLTVKWSCEHTLDYSSGGWTYDKQSPDKEVIYTYTDGSIKEARVVLPRIGEFEITTETMYGKNRAKLTYSPSGPGKHDRLIGDNWYTKYYGNQENKDEFTVYVPCNSGK